jgi:putative spermidine/putrescine transport system permease protein
MTRPKHRVAPIPALFAPVLLLFLTTLFPAIAILMLVSTYQFTGISVQPVITFDAYRQFFTDRFYLGSIVQGAVLAGVSTLICLALGYPTAYALTRLKRPKLALVAYILIFSPLLTSIVVRAYGWLVLLSGSGLVNWLLVHLHVTDAPVRLMFNFTGVVIALVHYLLPFAVFPMLSVLLRMDRSLLEAGADLGANRWQLFLRVTAPLSLPGIYVAAQLTFVLAMNSFVTPQLLGGGRVLVLPQLIYQNITTLNWPLASVQAIALVALVAATVYITNLLLSRR